MFTKAPRLLREVKETFNRDSEVTQSEIIARMGELDLLMIDEVGIQFGTDTERMILYETLDLIIELAKEFGVSSEAVLWRLLNLKIIKKSQVDKILIDPDFRNLDRNLRRGLHAEQKPEKFRNGSFPLHALA